MALNKDQILAADDLPKKEIHVPEWGGSVFVRTLTGLQRDQVEAYVRDTANLVGTRAYLCAQTICDEAGKLLFTLDEVDALAKKSGAALDRIFGVALELNKVSKEDVEALEKK